MQPYAELLEFNQPNPIRKPGFTRIRDSFPGLKDSIADNFNNLNFNQVSNPERIMEFAGRWDYGQNNARKLGEMSKMTMPAVVGNAEQGGVFPVKEVPIIQKYLSMGHESMIEMGDATFFIECSRVVSHELVRHRLASFQQESQRFSKLDDEDVFFVPDELPDDWDDGAGLYDDDVSIRAHYQAYMQDAQGIYEEMIRKGVPKQIARYILPNATRTRLIMKANAREWRHILKLRLDKSAQPEMQQVAHMIYDQLIDIFPNTLHGVLDGERSVR